MAKNILRDWTLGRKLVCAVTTAAALFVSNVARANDADDYEIATFGALVNSANFRQFDTFDCSGPLLSIPTPASLDAIGAACLFTFQRIAPSSFDHFRPDLGYDSQSCLAPNAPRDPSINIIAPVDNICLVPTAIGIIPRLRIFEATILSLPPPPPTDMISEIAKTDGDPGDTPGNPGCGDPICLGTGNVFEEVDDYQTAGRNKLSFSRYYNSQGQSNTFAVALGAKWRSTYDRYLRTTPSTVVAERADGRVVGFTLKNGVWTSDSDVDLKLTQSGAIWTLTDAIDTAETYSTDNSGKGVLTSIKSRNGYTQNLQYANGQPATVTDSFGRVLHFSYQNGLLQSVITPDGLVLSYSFSSSGTTGKLDRLASVAYSTVPQTSQSYVYENSAFPFALTGVIDENGDRFSTWTYDQKGRGTSSQRAGGAELTTVSYNDVDGSRTVTSALGEQEIYIFAVLQGVPKVTEIDRPATTTTVAATRKFTYDANGYLATATDWNGNLTTYVNDIHGQPISIAEAAGTQVARTTTITYHPVFHLPTQIATPGLTTTFAYDNLGNQITKTETDTIPGGVSRTWNYTYAANGLLTTVQGPRTDVKQITSLAYDSSGTLVSVTNALGQTTRVTAHAPGGLPQTIVDPNGVVSELAYDTRLRLISQTLLTSAGKFATNFSYDPVGSVIETVQPDGAAIDNGYDAAHRLTRATNLLGQRIDYTLDALGDRTQTTISGAAGVTRKHTSNFDALGQLLRDIGGVGQTTENVRDANGNAVSITDPLGRITTQVFDALNRLNTVTDPLKGVTAIAYDTHDRVIGVTDPNGNATQYTRDGFGHVIRQQSPDTGISTAAFDPADNLVQSVNAARIVANHTYDALNRVTSTTYPGNPAENVSFTYDEPGHGFGVGHLTSVKDQAGMLSLVYDERGNVIRETRTVLFAVGRFSRSETRVTFYGYDPANRVASITYPSGLIGNYARDVMGQVEAITAVLPGSDRIETVVANVAHLPFGPAANLTYGNGIVATNTFDLDYREASRFATGRVGTIQKLALGYDAADNVLSISDAGVTGNGQTFGYDTLNRLTSAEGAAYGRLTWTYDAVGNRLSQKRSLDARADAALTTDYGYAPGSSELDAMDIGPITEKVGSTAFGAIDSISGLGATTAFIYNQTERFAAFRLAGLDIAHYAYDAFGQRLMKSVAGATTLFQYDQAGDLLEETDALGFLPTDYIYLDGRPIGEVTGKQLYFTHTDRLGTPQIATDGNQRVVWDATYEPFGSATVRTARIQQNLRFPGQHFDVESGLHQNGFRDYNPALGRYTESDPIGLTADINTYQYARENPLKFVDRSGTQVEAEPASPYAPSDIIGTPGGLLPEINQRYNDASQIPDYLQDTTELQHDLGELRQLFEEYARTHPQVDYETYNRSEIARILRGEGPSCPKRSGPSVPLPATPEPAGSPRFYPTYVANPR